MRGYGINDKPASGATCRSEASDEKGGEFKEPNEL